MAVLTDDTLSGDSFNGYGGHIENTGVLTLTNDTVASNTSTGYAGGVLNYGGTLTLDDDTIYANQGVNFGGGLWTDFGGSTTIANTIVAGNTCKGMGYGVDAYGTFNSLGTNLIGKTDGSSGWITSDLTGTNANPLAPVSARWETTAA